MQLQTALRVLLVAAALIAAPYSISRSGELQPNDAACTDATGKCCTESGSICNDGKVDKMDAYWSADGKC